MKQNNCLFSILTTCMLFSFFCCTSEKEEIKVDIKRYAVLLLDENGKLISMTKGVSTLPSGSQVLGTGYYANGDNCTLTYSPAHGYSSTCSWDWHDGTSVQTANSSSSTIRRDYKVTISETQLHKSYLLTLVASPIPGGTVSGNGTKQAGSTVNIKANANNNFSFDGWYSGNIKLSSNLSYSYIMPSANTTLTAKFSELAKKATITLETKKSGSYGPTIIMRAVGGGEKTIGTSCTISTTAQNYIDASGKINKPNFLGWFIGNKLISDQVSYMFTVTETVTYRAEWCWY